jgi:hypothetical protein
MREDQLGARPANGFAGDRILITNRVTEREILLDFPWVSLGFPDPILIVDGERSEYGVQQAAAARNALSTIVDPAGSEDAANFYWLPISVQQAYAALDPHRPAMVVIDSWDALIEEFIAKATNEKYSVPGREDIERLILAYMRRSAVTLVVVVEREGQSQLDYLVSAVVHAGKQTVDGRLERTLSIPKLRGLRIQTVNYPYTLEGSRFHSIAPFRHGEVQLVGPRPMAIAGDPSPGMLEGRIWPGNADFASEFGTFCVGRTTIIETDPSVPYPVPSLLVHSPIVQTLSAGGRVLILPPPGTRPDDLYSPLRGVFAAEALAAQLRIFSVTGTDNADPEAHPTILPLPDQAQGHPFDPRFRLGFEFIRQAGVPGVPNLIIRTTSGERAMDQLLKLPVTPENFARIVAAYVSNLASHQIVIGDTNDLLLGSLNDLGSLHLRLQTREGRYFLFGVRPFTTAFALTEGDRFAPYYLTRMV